MHKRQQGRKPFIDAESVERARKSGQCEFDRILEESNRIEAAMTAEQWRDWHAERARQMRVIRARIARGERPPLIQTGTIGELDDGTPITVVTMRNPGEET